MERKELLQTFVRDRGHYVGFLRVLCRDAELTEELFQELSLTVIEKISTFDPSREFDAWVRGIARNLYRRAMEKHRTRRTRQVTYDPALVDAVLAAYDSRTGAEEREKAEHAQRLKHCFDRLPEHHRKLLGDRYHFSLPILKLAELHHRSVTAVETALTRIRQALLDCMRRQVEAGS